MDSNPMSPPNYHNLEISGSWNGEFEGAVWLRISLDVESAPGTELRLLDTNSSPIFLKTASARLLSDELNDSSSLFAFSTSDSDNLAGAQRSSAEKPSSSDEAFSTTQDALPLPSRSVMEDILVHRSTALAEHSILLETFSQLCVNVAEYEDLTKSPQLMKRSATDACFDSESDCDDAPTHKRQVSSSDTIKTLSPVLRTGKESIKTDNLLGLEAWLETTAQQHENTTTEGSVSTGNGEPCREERTSDNVTSAADDATDVTGTKENDGLPTPATESPSQLSRTESPSTEQPDATPEPRAHSPGGQEDSPSGLPASPSLDLGIAAGLDSNSDARPSSPDTSILFSTPKHSNTNRETWEKHHSIEESDEYTDNEARSFIEFSCDPELLLTNGNLIVRFSNKTRQATYRIEVNLTVYVDEDYTKGWSTFLLPGLPPLQAEEIGLFFFLLPEDRGLEFRTTGMRRCMEMRGCFFAELTNPEKLAVPMRVCGRRFYGFLRNYILDQEIIARHVVSRSGAENDGSTEYYALCSLRLNKRYICTEKCGFSLYVDGGPDGLFFCKLEHQTEGLHMIKIPSSNSKGVSRVQVICSPKDLETFCLTWTISLDCCQRTGHWLPRIYPASPTHSQDHLRNTFTELHHRGCFEATHEDDKQLANDNMGAANESESHILESHISDDEASTGPELPSPNMAQTPGVVHLLHLLASTLKADLIQLIKDCDSLYHWTCSLLKRLIIAVATTYTLLGILTWISIKYVALGVLGPLQAQPIPLNMSELDTGNQTMVENIDAGLSACFDDRVFHAGRRMTGGCGSSSSPLSRLESLSIDAESYSQIGMQVQEGADDNDHGDIDANVGDTKTAGTHSFRDKIDYWLGWKGPNKRRV